MLKSFLVLWLVLITTCSTPSNKITTESGFILGKATVELSYITKDPNDLNKLLKDLDSHNVDSKFQAWVSKYSTETERQAIKLLIEKGHAGR